MLVDVVQLRDIKHLREIQLLVRILLTRTMNLDQVIGSVDFVIHTTTLVEMLVSNVREKNTNQEF